MENKLTLVKEAREIISQINIDLKNKVISLEQRNHILDVIKDIQWKIELSEVILRRGALSFAFFFFIIKIKNQSFIFCSD